MDMTEANTWLALGESIGRSKQATTTLLTVLETKFGRIPTEVTGAVQRDNDPTRVQTWTTQAAIAATLAGFRAAVGI